MKDNINRIKNVKIVIAIDVPKLAYLKLGIPPNKYSLKFQHIVGKNFNIFTSIEEAKPEIILDIKYVIKGTIIESAVFPENVLIKNANVKMIKYTGNTETNCNNR